MHIRVKVIHVSIYNVIVPCKSILISYELLTGRSYCLTFYYHMLGSQMGDLTVFTQNGTEAPVGQWSVSGVDQDEWKEHRIDLSLDPHTKVYVTIYNM